MTKRIIDTLDGYAALMKARHIFSASHKLPGSKGKMREVAVVEFLKAFIPNKLKIDSSVFAISPSGTEYNHEIDVAIHDTDAGGFWHLDTFGHNSICTINGLKVAIEVKSEINKENIDHAENQVSDIRAFAQKANIDPPICVLFCYSVSPANKNSSPSWLGLDTIEERASIGNFAFDAVICPDEFAYFSPEHDEFSLGFERRISTSMAKNDGTIQDYIVAKRFSDSRYSNSFLSLGNSPGTRLLALAAFISHISGNDPHLAALLSTALHPEHNPITDSDD